ncbi:MAG: DUF6508 domain-containing protein [Candidatus Promineifilaceae bacterium]
MDATKNSSDPDRERLQALAAFLPLFEAPGFEFGVWQGSRELGPGHYTMPYFEPGKTALAFVQTTYAQNWVLRGWDWPAWTQTEEAVRLRDDPAALAAASAEQLAKLLTVLIRQDRFVEGGLDSAFESGLLTAIARRATVLAQG